MTKVIQIRDDSYRVEVSPNCLVCDLCAFRHTDCPRGDNGTLFCTDYGFNAYFVKPKPEEIPAAKLTTYTTEQVKKTFLIFATRFALTSYCEQFMETLELHSDPEYTEFMRLKEKFYDKIA